MEKDDKKRTSDTERLTGAGVILTKPRTNEILIVLGRNGMWGFPKGHSKHGEHLIATATRELYEETNMVAMIPADATTIAFAKRPSRAYFVLRMSDVLVEGDPARRPDHKEVAEVRWAKFDDIADLKMNSSLKNYITRRVLTAHVCEISPYYVPEVEEDDQKPSRHGHLDRRCWRRPP